MGERGRTLWPRPARVVAGLVLSLGSVLTFTLAATPGSLATLSSCTPGPDADLAGCNFSNANLNSDNLSGSNLTGADLSGATLTNTNFTGADLTDANLADFAIPDSCSPTSCTWTVSNSGSTYTFTFSDTPNFTDAVLTGADISGDPLGGQTYDEGVECLSPGFCGPTYGVYLVNLRGVTSGGMTGAPSSLPPGFTVVKGAFAAPPGFSSPAEVAFMPTQSGAFTVVATGAPTPALTESGTLPAGVTFTANGDGTGVLSWTPTSGTLGAFPVTFTAANSSGPASHQALDIEVGVAPTLVSFASSMQGAPDALDSAFEPGRFGSITVTATGAPTPSVSESGALPPGVTFIDNGNGTGVLAGTPTGAFAVYPIHFTAENGVGSPDTEPYLLYVGMTITTTSMPNGVLFVHGQPSTKYSSFVSAEGGNPPFRFSLAPGSGPLPPGLRLNDHGLISGSATAQGTYTFTVQVVDKKSKKTRTIPSIQNKATQTLSITIGP